MPDFSFLDFAEEVSNLDPVAYAYFDGILRNRTIILNEEITENILETVFIPLKKFEDDEDKTPVKLILNTPGGSVADGLMLCGLIDNYKKPLEILVPGYACSMGTIILCAGNKNPNVIKRCYPFSFALFHSGQTYVGGESTSVEDVMLFNKSTDERIRDYILANTNISAEIYDAHHRKQWYLTAKEMKEYKLVHEIIGEDNNANS